MSRVVRKPLGFSIRSDTNWPVQPQKMARGLKFQAKARSDLIWACVLCMQKSRFSHDTA